MYYCNLDVGEPHDGPPLRAVSRPVLGRLRRGFAVARPRALPGDAALEVPVGLGLGGTDFGLPIGWQRRGLGGEHAGATRRGVGAPRVDGDDAPRDDDGGTGAAPGRC